MPYLPGQTPRPAEGVFDALKGGLDGLDPAGLADSACFRAGFEAFDRRLYWEAHELWEPVWLRLPEGAERALVQGVIQLANCGLKRRMGRVQAAMRIIPLAEAALARAYAGGVAVMGVSRSRVTGMQEIATRELQYNAESDLTKG
ncbi:MAG: DUF309 domain-containing protein [Rhodobacteraceae bacterium]|nr:DUF309 domain-containing protein [Paracoccaceae bacterium]